MINVSAKFAQAPIDKSIPSTASEYVRPVAIIVVIEMDLNIVIMFDVVKNILPPTLESQFPNVNIRSKITMVTIVPHFITKLDIFIFFETFVF